jgi:hypothetical protein
MGKLASLAATLSLFAAPLAFAGTETGSEHTPEGVPPSYSGEENPGSEYMPEGVPPEATPPEGVPLGPPEETRPEGVPLGPPEGTPPPEGVPLGPPEGLPLGPPEGVASSGTAIPDMSQPLSAGAARTIGREECQEFKKNFGDNRSQFGKCIADVAGALHGAAAPGRACADMNRKPEEGEHRSDFSACVAAAAQALKEQ